MNKLFYFIISHIIFPIATLAQEITPIPLEGSLDLYVGTWKYENSETNEVFIVKLQKFDNYTLTSNCGTVIIGEYSYSKDDITIYNGINNLQNVTSNNDAFNVSIHAFGDHDSQDYSNLGVWVRDKTYIKTPSGTLKFALSRTSHTLIWKINENAGDYDILEGDDTPEGLSIPSNIVLIKVSD